MHSHQIIKIFGDIKKCFFGTSEFSYVRCSNNILYPIDLSFTLEDEEFYYTHKDDDGVPVKHYTSVGMQYNPTRVAAYGLAHFNRYTISKSVHSEKIFLKCADWFLFNEQARYFYNFDWQSLKAPWISCMSQGEAASLLIRGYLKSNSKIYLDHAELSLEPFFLPIDQGGVSSRLSDGSLFLEEYPSSNPVHVLNGFLYALIGLHEFAKISGSKRHLDLYKILVCSLQDNIGNWDSGKWSFYEDPNVSGMSNWCTPSYHNLQISQLIWLNEQTPSEHIAKTINRWIQGRDSLAIRLRALVQKSIFRSFHKAQR